MLKTISTTEWLNYEYEDEAKTKPKKFSKSRSIGVFGDDAMNSGIPVEVWRYYLLSMRPEISDAVYLWDDFAAKNNNELVKNLGNFSNRVLKFLSSKFDGVIPAYKGALHEKDVEFYTTLNSLLNEYIKQMEDVKLKSALKTCMQMSSACNLFIQENAPWDLAKSDMNRCEQVVNTLAQTL